MPRITAQDLPPQDHNEDAHAPTLKPWENTTRSSGFDDAPPAASSTRSSGFPPSTQDLRDDFHAPTSDSPSREAPAQDHSTALPRGRIFEKRSAPESFLRQQLGRNASGPSSQQRLQGSHQVLAAQQQARGANPPTKGGAPAAQPQALAQAQRPAAAPAQAAPAAPHSPAGSGWVDQAGQHPYKIHEADENAEIVRTADASAPPPQKGAKFGEHARSVINAALENSPTARAVLNKARELSGKDVVIHSTTATNAQPYIGLDGTIHIYVNPNTLLPGTLAHETAHAIQNWYQQAAKRGAAPPTDQELDDAKLRGRQELHKIAPVTYIDPRSKPEDDTSDHEPRSKSTENEAMRIANIVNAEISAAKVKAKMEAFKKERPEEFETMLKDPKKMAESVAQSFWFEQKKLEAISHQTDMHVPMRESTLYGKEGGLKHVLEMLGYGVTESHIKNAAPIRHRYAPPTPPR
ncbi:hypothetical protein [Prosthecobacter fluviatilis]|uniref:DUF4157 domain-containing protein n=1 Tax=Prosthecobacter fluviatilis TaxID=445931 RepID=A0ABW0KWC0_9BACT